MRLALLRYDIIGREPPARLQHAVDLAIEPRAVGDVHRHVLQEGGVEAAIVEGKFQRVAGLEGHLPALPGARGQIARGVHEGLAEVDAGDAAAKGRRQEARRPADTRADIQHRHVRRDPGQLGKLRGRSQPPGVKLVEAGELLRHKPLILGTEHGQRRLQPLGQPSRAIMVAYALQHFGHVKTPADHLQAKCRAASRERLSAIMSTGYEAELHSPARRP